ncbi:MobC family plasmid mobilization relaxosome protein [Streptomyces hirsutus]|uniref:MobC family plasmid mobilization relaxosome protein n=1 Tax=Streptomyces hirsutus TaxID=35620 RepID=A0ABZ1GPX8_9ACTN|nr:MobC family plasmid mobilization relaxosome protein [Streptomyces hirsutus]WSD08190.1 MobC family plasmid mobilization relaxosome protein [Streptomyces hirsutus]WTD18359.1 MobC family plasmid mobilization relaxosome protein [Streptomyces hirsutus]
MRDDPADDAPSRPRGELLGPAHRAAARYAVGPSKVGPNGDASAPEVAKDLGHQGVPEREEPVDTAAVALPRAAEAAALHRVARRRKPDPNGQRKERVDARYSIDEKKDILRMARSLNIAGAHYVGAVVMAHVHGDLALSGQRTPLDDYIDELTALRGEVAKIGHNINQIAKKLNSGGHPHPGDTAVLVQAERTLTTVGATVRHIAAAANQAVAKKAAR